MAAQRGDQGGPLWAVIPAGGSGTRLWPVSRATRPKFLLPLTSNRSLLQQTYDRLLRLTDPAHILVVCGPAHSPAIARQLPDLPDDNIIVEPSPRGTLPALALASALIARRDPNAIVGSFAADHIVAEPGRFVDAVHAAVTAAQTEALVTIGLTPTRPDTGYGYIERTDEVVAESPAGIAYRAARFVEKPDLQRAQEYMTSGNYLWNAAMFMWQAGTFLQEVARLQPEVASGVAKIVVAWPTLSRERVTASVWHGLPDVTIDTGIMERTENVAVVPAEMGWSDIGDWHSLGEIMEPDSRGNAIRGDVVQIDTSNSVVWSETGRPVAIVGLDSVIVVDTEDALLIADREQAQNVRRIVDLLKSEGHPELA